ncbi:PREDICTED: HLA class II histocompatibility antigen, DRB1-1 beta chain-like [Chinchilla lanigera]|uniref:HLA class II histocompatibility antigen, DRB1-1 beta chain-like n=1 Tax=Chinchilla lanigera TaxID=34839 RepID=UPI000695A957|nr:PREDICTED: HLA class II histocompatibility antigen, DRB1-1 beta chain-like [Chinchilla lanigera]
MLCLWLPGGSCMAAVTVTLMVLSPPLALARDTQPCFLEYIKWECHFSNGTEYVRMVVRHIYNQEEFLRYDSDLGKFLAVTELGQQEAKDWNSRKDLLEQRRSQVDTLCKHNYRVGERFTVQRRVEPKVTVYPTMTQPLQHHNLLVCSVSGFYPGHMEVRWFRNGQEEEAGVVSTGLIRNGDWTFQTLVMLETVPRSEEVYACQVEHPSWSSPVTVEWSEWETPHLISSPPAHNSLSVNFLLAVQYLHLLHLLIFRTIDGGRTGRVSTNTYAPLTGNCLSWGREVSLF